METDLFITFLNVIIGLAIILSSLSSLSLGYKGRKDFVSIGLALISLLAGIVVMFTHTASSSLTILLGQP